MGWRGPGGGSSSLFMNSFQYLSFPIGEAASLPRTLPGGGGKPKVKGSAQRPRDRRQTRSGGKLAATARLARLPPGLSTPLWAIRQSVCGGVGVGGELGDWPCVLEQLLPALGPPGMREQAAHQDFYGNLLLETATAATAARGLPAAGAAAAEAPRPLPTPQCRTRTASLRATRTLARLRLQAGERSRERGAGAGAGAAKVSGLSAGAGAAGRCSPRRGSWPRSAAKPESARLPPAVATRLSGPRRSAEQDQPGSPALGAISVLRSPALAPLAPCRLSFGCFLYPCRGRALRERRGCRSLCPILGIQAGKV